MLTSSRLPPLYHPLRKKTHHEHTKDVIRSPLASQNKQAAKEERSQRMCLSLPLLKGWGVFIEQTLKTTAFCISGKQRTEDWRLYFNVRKALTVEPQSKENENLVHILLATAIYIYINLSSFSRAIVTVRIYVLYGSNHLYVPLHHQPFMLQKPQ